MSNLPGSKNVTSDTNELQQEVIEEEENDDFENLYRGQISKSGIAILPSKRTRKIPEANKAATRVISLPLHPYMDSLTQETIVKSII